jgi:phage baseplate assembly protein W
MNIAYPFQFDKRGRTAAASDSDHIRDMIEELLFTSPGERVNRPDFGSGLLQMVFSPNRIEVAATLQYTIQAALQRWLGDVIQLQAVDVTAVDSTLSVSVAYVIRQTGQTVLDTFTRNA